MSDKSEPSLKYIFKKLPFKDKVLACIWTFCFFVFIGGKKPVILYFWILLPSMFIFSLIAESRAWNNNSDYVFLTFLLSIPYYALLYLLVKWILKVGQLQIEITSKN